MYLFIKCLQVFLFVVQQLFIDVTSNEVHSEIADEVTAMDNMIAELQELSNQLRDQC